MCFEALGVTVSIHLEVRLPVALLTNHSPHQGSLGWQYSIKNVIQQCQGAGDPQGGGQMLIFETSLDSILFSWLTLICSFFL